MTIVSENSAGDSGPVENLLPAKSCAICTGAWTGAAMLLAGGILFLAIAADVHFHGIIARIDPAVAEFLYQHVSGWGTVLFSAISEMGELVLIAPLGVMIGIWLIVRKRWRAVAGWAAALLGSAVICSTLKNCFAVPRPSHFTTYVFEPGSGFSFPSGHTMSVAIFAGALAIVLTHVQAMSRRRRMWLWLAAAALGVLEAAALLMIGVHYLTDVLGALAISLAWLGVVRMILPPRMADEFSARDKP